MRVFSPNPCRSGGVSRPSRFQMRRGECQFVSDVRRRLSYSPALPPFLPSSVFVFLIVGHVLVTIDLRFRS